MKSNGYTEKELSEVFAFQSFRSEYEVLSCMQFHCTSLCTVICDALVLVIPVHLCSHWQCQNGCAYEMIFIMI